MKKVRSLQILVYIVFGLFVIQNIAADAWQGFRSGWNYNYVIETKPGQQGPVLLTMLDGSFFTNATDGRLKVNDIYTLSDVSIISKIHVNNTSLKTPDWLIALKIIFLVGLAFLLFRMAAIINKVIMHIYTGSMFDGGCIALIRKTGALVLLFALADYAYQRLDYAEQCLLIHAPLRVINTTIFNFGLLLTAIFIYIIAEAFKQGNRLKEEQELTI